MLDSYQRKPILIVDDETQLLSICKNFLKEMGHRGRVVQATDGAEASLKVANEEFGLILLDLNMPKMNGVSFLKQFRKKDKNKDVPVVIISGHVTKEVLSELIVLNVRCFITKPFEFEVFIDKIHSAIEYAESKKKK